MTARKDYRPEPMHTLMAFLRDSHSESAVSVSVFVFLAADDGTALGWILGTRATARKTANCLSDKGRPCRAFKMTPAA